MQKILQRHLVFAEVPHHVTESFDLFGCLIATARDEPLHVHHGARQIRQRAVQIRSAVVEHAADGGEAILELDDLDVAVPQCGNERLQVRDDVDDVSAAVGEDAAQTGQLPDGLAQPVSVAVQRVGRTVDEPAHRRGRHATARTEICCQAGQLGFDLIPLDGHRGPVQVDHRAIAHRRTSGLIRRRQLDVSRADQVLGNDHGFGVDRNGHIPFDGQRHFRFGALRFDRRDVADLHTGDPNLITGINRCGTGKIGRDGGRLQHGVADQKRDACGDEHGEYRGDGSVESFTGHPGTCPARRHGSGSLLFGNGNSARGPALSGGWPALTPRRNPKM